ncbi:hypothetical protein R1flu_017668 [Riccia fluitans]|uniref:Reverse transcriptase domain-containing protein n=1 Tax=Riccia fluitans TaxID=41844 RepID=A0ABD1ZDW9_9MARC
MGFAEGFIRFTKGLVEDSTSKIHANRQFSEKIQIERGVKQGCPLFFAIATQPSMTLLKSREMEERIHGLHLQGQNYTLHNLFADDSEVMLQAAEENFNELKEAIATYETISGVKLNICKSTIIPVTMGTTPSWLS